jgi:transcriptional regulator with XRE-family HTH domain
LREARLKAGLSQEALAKLAGIPRNQVVRAERGDNITVDTLRKIAVHLPVSQLTLIDMKTLMVDVLPEPERLFFEAADTVVHVAAAMQTALTHAMTAGRAVESARRNQPLPSDLERGEGERPDDLMALLQALLQTVTGLLSAHQVRTPRSAKITDH